MTDITYISKYASRRGASDSITDSSVLSNPADAQNVSCLGRCGRDICPKKHAKSHQNQVNHFRTI